MDQILIMRTGYGKMKPLQSEIPCSCKQSFYHLKAHRCWLWRACPAWRPPPCPRRPCSASRPPGRDSQTRPSRQTAAISMSVRTADRNQSDKASGNGQSQNTADQKCLMMFRMKSAALVTGFALNIQFVPPNCFCLNSAFAYLFVLVIDVMLRVLLWPQPSSNYTTVVLLDRTAAQGQFCFLHWCAAKFLQNWETTLKTCK